MPTVQRTRTRVIQGVAVRGLMTVTSKSTGAVSTFSGHRPAQNQGEEHCVDYVEDPVKRENPHYFSLLRQRARVPHVNGTRETSTSIYNYSDFSLDIGGTVPTMIKPSISYLPSANELAIKARANANPNKPVVDLPLFLWELRELPDLLRYIGSLEARLQRGRTLPRAAEGYLSYRFGWDPLLSDLASLLALKKATENVAHYFEQIRRGHRLKRNLYTFSDEIHAAPYYYKQIDSTCLRRTKIQVRCWYTAKISSDESYWVGRDINETAFYSALGLNGLRLATVWNALPWTWLIDYFHSLGDFVSAHSGVIPFKMTNLCIMRNLQSTTTMSWIGGIHPADPHLSHYELKKRDPSSYSGFPGFKFRILQPSQIAILGSLILARSGGRRAHSSYTRNG